MEADRSASAMRDSADGARDFVTIFTSSMSEVAVLEAALEGRGFHAFVAGRNIKTLDPFATVIDPFGVRLQVPREEASAAFAALAELVGERALPHVETDEEREARFEAVTRLGQRVRWAALCPPIAPLGAVLGLAYFFRSLYLAEKPVGHGVTLLSLWLCWVWTAAGLPLALAFLARL